MAASPPASKAVATAVIRQRQHLTIMKRELQPPREAAALFAPPCYLHCCSRTRVTCCRKVSSTLLGKVCNSWWFLLLFVLIVLGSGAVAMNTCSHKQARVLQFDDAGAKAYLAPVVFRGLVKTRTPVDANGMYEASFLILQPIKGFVHQMPKKKRRRLQFAAPSVGALCRHGAVAAPPLDNNATYLVFADRAVGHQFRALSPPLPATKRHEDAVERSLCANCVRPPRVSGLHNVTVRAKLKLKLTCHYDGNPPPLIEWYKRGRRIEPSKRTKIVTKKRRSVLTIVRVSKSDAGKYECKAVSVTDEKVCASAHVTVTNEQPPSRLDNSTTLWPLVDTPCPINSYCLNGGTCLYYEAVGELVCECAEGYKGKRCENKDVYNRGSKRRRTSCCGGDDGQQQQQPPAVSAAALVLRRRVSDCLSSSNCAAPPTTSLHQRRRRLRHVLFAKSLPSSTGQRSAYPGAAS